MRTTSVEYRTLLGGYEVVASAAEDMAHAARERDAIAWSHAWTRCEAGIARIGCATRRPPPGSEPHRIRVALLKRILAADADIRRALDASYARLERLFGRASRAR